MCAFQLKPVFLNCYAIFFSLSFHCFYGSSSFQFQKSVLIQSCVCVCMHTCACTLSVFCSICLFSSPLHRRAVQQEYLWFMNGPGPGPYSEMNFRLHLPLPQGLKNPTGSSLARLNSRVASSIIGPSVPLTPKHIPLLNRDVPLCS